MAKKKKGIFPSLKDVYKTHDDDVDNIIIHLIQGFLFVLTIVVIFAVLLATGLFVF